MGDCVNDIEDFEFLFSNFKFNVVSGNCDYFSVLPTTKVANVGGKGVFYTHGHTLGVKGSREHLKKAALQSNCQIALYGHTHTPEILYEDGLYIVNPGSCANPRNSKASYAVIDIEENGIMPIIIEI